MDQFVGDSSPLTEQQKAQHTLSIYLSKASALLTENLAQTDIRQEKPFGDLAMLLQRINREMTYEVDRNQSLDNLYLHIGSKESTQRNGSIGIVVKALSCEDRPQRIASGDQVTLVAPSVLPGIFVLQTQRLNGSPTNKYQQYFLVGERKLPKDYQAPLTPRI